MPVLFFTGVVLTKSVNLFDVRCTSMIIIDCRQLCGSSVWLLWA